jgi:hypothetical protein
MNRTLWRFAGLCTLALVAVWAMPANAQMNEMKEKPPMYTYVGFWNVPRAQWGDFQKSEDADQKVLSQAMASGTIIGYGDDINLVHTVDGATHDDWWSSMSMAGLMNVLNQFYSNGSATQPALQSVTKHWDGIYVTHFYNWKSGSWKGLYTHGGQYKLKADAPDDAVAMLAKNFIVPVLEKQLADGTIYEYEIDTEAIHTDPPGTFWIFYIAANADGLDKVNAAVQAAVKANPLALAAFDSMTDFTGHRDYLSMTNATYK